MIARTSISSSSFAPRAAALRGAPGLAIIVVIGWSVTAAAQPAPAVSDRDVAAQRVEEGTRLYDAGDYAGALAKFDAAFQRFPAPTLHFNRGLALDKLGRWVEAAQAYARFLDEQREIPADVRREATGLLAAADRKIARLSVTSSGPEGQILVDGVARGSTPRTLRVAVGTYRIDVIAADRSTWSTTITAGAGAVTTIVATPTLVASPGAGRSESVPARDEPASGSPIYTRWWFWTAAAVVVAGAAAGGWAMTRDPAPPTAQLGTERVP